MQIYQGCGGLEGLAGEAGGFCGAAGLSFSFAFLKGLQQPPFSAPFSFFGHLHLQALFESHMAFSVIFL
jgi:hypothetical protein